MKLTLLFPFLFFAGSLQLNAQLCSDQEITLTSQADIDNFTTNFPNCDQVKTLIIQGPEITNLHGLHALKSSFEIIIKETPNLQSLSGLENLQSSSIFVLESTGISTMEGLNNLDIVMAIFVIQNNDQLVDLTGLDDLKEVHSLDILNNQKLVNLAGLNILETLYSLSVTDNPSFVNLTGMPSLRKLDWLYAGFNESLVDFTGLEQIDGMNNDLFVVNNPNLSTLEGLQNIEIARNIEIRNNDALVSLQGLESLTEVTRFEIISNPALESLHGLNSLNTISDRFLLNQNPQLEDLTSLTELRTVGGTLFISQNESLTNLAGLDFINTIGNLEITFNANLALCAVESICNHLTSGGPAAVGGNENGCTTAAKILESCTVAADDPRSSQVSLYPNPANGVVHLDGLSQEVVVIHVFDSHGRICEDVVMAPNKLNLSSLNQGIYFIKIKTDRDILVKPVTRL